MNLKHQFLAAQAVYPMMKRAGGGSVINMGSTSWMVGQGGMAAYTAAKSAVLGLTRELMTRQCLKRQLVPDDIARVVLFMASDASSAMTNQSYIVDGGWV